MEKEKTVISYFPSSTKAKTAVDALATAGFTDSHVRRASKFGVADDSILGGGIVSAELSAMTLYSMSDISETRADKVLLDADPSVSGMSARGYGMAGGHAWTLVSFVPESQVDEAIAIIRQNGGET